MKPINVGLLGIGTVGGGTFTVLARNEAEITRRAGRPIRITKVADKNLELARQVAAGRAQQLDEFRVAARQLGLEDAPKEEPEEEVKPR